MNTNYNAILYTDGSCIGNPSEVWGSGVHGYVYDVNNNKKSNDKPTNYEITNAGYIETAFMVGADKYSASMESASNTVLIPVNPYKYINGYVSYTSLGSNNTAEVMAAIEAIEFILDNLDEVNVIDIKIKTDSTYLIHIHTNITAGKNWNTPDTKNVDYWNLLNNVMERCKELSIELSLEKVTAHDTSLGNNLADRLAMLASSVSSKRREECVIKYVDGAKYWKPKTDKHPFINFKNLYFTNGNRDKGIYSVMKYAKDSEPGEKSHKAIFGYVMLNDPIQEIENIKQLYQNNLNSLEIISTIDIGVLYSQNTTMLSGLFGNDVFSYSNKNRKQISVLNEEVVCSEIFPPGLAKNALDKIIVMSNILEQYKKNNTIIGQYVDITGLVYKVNDAGKNEIILGINDKFVECGFTVDEKDIKLKLELGRDILARSQLSAIVKYKPKITLIALNPHVRFIEYYVVVEMMDTNDISIWCNFFSNKIFLERKKK